MRRLLFVTGQQRLLPKMRTGRKRDYIFKCSNCGADIAGGRVKGGYIISIYRVVSEPWVDPPALESIPIPRLTGAVSLQCDDGVKQIEIPMKLSNIGNEVTYSSSMTISGNCPGCGAAYSRTVRG